MPGVCALQSSSSFNTYSLFILFDKPQIYFDISTITMLALQQLISW